MQLSQENRRFYPVGAFVNALTVTAGSLIGLYFNAYLNQSYQDELFQAIGLGVLLMGIQMGLRLPSNYWVAAMISLIFGTLLGGYLDIASSLDGWASHLKEFFSINDTHFSQGLVTAFILFCVGAMTILGSLEEGLTGNRSIIFTKAILDGFTSMFLAGAYGIGVLFSVIPLFLLQSSITLSAKKIRPLLNDTDLDIISGIGGILIMGIGIEMLGIKDIRLENMLPALLFIPLGIRITHRLE